MEWSLPFFKTLWGAEPFRWTEDCQKSLEDLLLYLTATTTAVSMVLVQEHNGGKTPRVLCIEGPPVTKVRYMELEKLVYALLMASQKLRHYSLAHTITVLTSYPLALMPRNKDVMGQIGKWDAELAPST